MIKKEFEILMIFAQKPWKTYTFTEIMEMTKKKSKSYVSGVIEKYIHLDVLRKDFVGHLPVYSLNFSSQKAGVFAGFVLENHGWEKDIPHDELEKAMEKIPYKSHVFIVTGSYARGKQTGKSDIDVVILIEDAGEPKKVYAELSHYCGLSIPKIHLYAFRYSEFLEMLLKKEENYGKEIVGNFIILAGGQTYLKIIKEAVQNEFKG